MDDETYSWLVAFFTSPEKLQYIQHAARHTTKECETVNWIRFMLIQVWESFLVAKKVKNIT